MAIVPKMYIEFEGKKLEVESYHTTFDGDFFIRCYCGTLILEEKQNDYTIGRKYRCDENYHEIKKTIPEGK